MRVVDFHNHFVAGGFAMKADHPRLASPEALVASLDEAQVAARVISTPFEFLRDGEAEVRRINDAVAALVARHPGRLYGLATVDAYGGEPAAGELARAVRELGLRGVFMESAKGDLLPDAPQARAVLAAAASLGVPVLLHPVADGELERRFRRFGRLGARLTRGTINAAALFALLEGGVFEELPGLRVVVTALAFGGVLLAAGMPDGAKLGKDTPARERRHVYVDTTGMDRVAVRGAIEVVGADHVVTGTDWPIVQEKSVPSRLAAMFDEIGLAAGERRAVAGENALRLLGAA